MIRATDKALHTFFSAVLTAAAAISLVSCGGGSGAVSHQRGDAMRFDFARNITIDETDSFAVVRIRNPWDTLRTLHTYVLVADSLPVPSSLPEGTLVRTPLKNALVYSAVHVSLIDEFGAGESRGGVCDSKYIHTPAVTARMADGSVADCGIGTAPDLEKIMMLSPDAIMLSPFENSGGYGRVTSLGIPIIECADYMEPTPLGRAEWMKFYGMLFGRSAMADSLFRNSRNEYERLMKRVKNVETRPEVLVDRLYGSQWYVPGGQSTMGLFITHAGGTNPFASRQSSGSYPVSGEEVLLTARNAPVWLIRYNQSSDMTYGQLESDSPFYPLFDAFGRKRVYGCNTAVRYFYEEVPFHPQWLLAELISIIHPGLVEPYPGHSYFIPLQP